jgi:hypothetical protein
MNIAITKNRFAGLMFGVFLGLITNVAYSQSCESYPYQPLSDEIIFEENGKFKLIFTSSVLLDFDDPSEVMSARREANLKARRGLAEYINQNLSSQDKIDEEIRTSRTNAKTEKGVAISKVERDSVKTKLTGISSKSDAVLKGVIAIGSCLTKGREVRVTVGIKSDTIENAEKLGTSMGVDKAMTYGTNPNTPSNSDKSNQNAPAGTGTQGYDASSGIRKF